MPWFRNARHKAAASHSVLDKTLVQIDYSIWSSEDHTHLLHQTVRLPLPDARVLRVELDAAIGTAEAKAREASRAA